MKINVSICNQIRAHNELPNAHQLLCQMYLEMLIV